MHLSQVTQPVISTLLSGSPEFRLVAPSFGRQTWPPWETPSRRGVPWPTPHPQMAEERQTGPGTGLDMAPSQKVPGKDLGWPGIPG